jgi:hypothetical protein
MAKSTFKKISKDFKKAVKDYIGAISHDYNSRQGDDSTRQPCGNKIIELFRAVPLETKPFYIVFFLEQMIEPTNEIKLTVFRCQKTLEMKDELSDIIERENGSRSKRNR